MSDRNLDSKQYAFSLKTSDFDLKNSDSDDEELLSTDLASRFIAGTTNDEVCTHRQCLNCLLTTLHFLVRFFFSSSTKV